MSLFDLCHWLQHTRLATAIAESDWLFPLIEGSHILALPWSVGLILIADLHLLGLAFADESAARVVGDFVRWSKIGFAIVFITGGFLLLTQAEKAYGNAFFRAKMLFLLLLGLNALAYQRWIFPRMPAWIGRAAPAAAKGCAAFSLVLWLGVIVCGRTMAYQF